MSQLLILSGAYPDQELVSEFGNLPPAFLPVGNKRLYELQAESIPHSSLWITLPASFKPDKVDLDKLKKLNANLIFTNENLSLGDAFITGSECLQSRETHILFGDTLVKAASPFFFDTNTIVTGDNKENYPWHILNSELTLDNKEILAGYFYVVNLETFRISVKESSLNFIEGIYRQHIKEPWHVSDKLDWLDFGHINTYFQSKLKISTARSFNGIRATKRVITKYSENRLKIIGEARWFERMPNELSPYLAQYAGMHNKNGEIGYSTEFIYLNTLAEHYVFSKLPANAWDNIFESCLEFLSSAYKFTESAESKLDGLLLPKTISRLGDYKNAGGVAIDQPWILNGIKLPSLTEIAYKVATYIRPRGEASSIVHGDLCFSNIFYDFRSRGIKLIDPRGLDANDNQTIFGDPRYDVAKLHHSVIGGYDYILAGRYNLSIQGQNIEFELPVVERIKIQEKFLSLSVGNINFNSKEICAISVLLFISMLPLHCDRKDRQLAFIANALRLYVEVEKMP